jgi:hypothetical protein
MSLTPLPLLLGVSQLGFSGQHANKPSKDRLVAQLEHLLANHQTVRCVAEPGIGLAVFY